MEIGVFLEAKNENLMAQAAAASNGIDKQGREMMNKILMILAVVISGVFFVPVKALAGEDCSEYCRGCADGGGSCGRGCYCYKELKPIKHIFQEAPQKDDPKYDGPDSKRPSEGDRRLPEGKK